MALQFSDSVRKEIEEVISRYPKRDAALLPVLWIAQREFGYLSADARRLVSEILDVSLARVESVVSFYTLYKTEPTGKHHVQVCRNISCMLRGCEELQSTIERELAIAPGESTKDGLFTYSLVECLAACGGAPALQVNSQYHENVTVESLKKLIEELRKHG